MAHSDDPLGSAAAPLSPEQQQLASQMARKLRSSELRHRSMGGRFSQPANATIPLVKIPMAPNPTNTEQDE